MNEHTQKSHLVEMTIIIETFHTNFSLIETLFLSLNETEIFMKSLNDYAHFDRMRLLSMLIHIFISTRVEFTKY